VRLPNGMTARQWADATASDGGSVSMTQQSFAQELDINTILRRFNVTGQAPLGAMAPMYGDFTGLHDWEDAVEKVTRAREDFMRLPPEIRERFQNDPGQLIEYAQSHSFEQFTEEAEAVAKRRDAAVAAKAAYVAALSAPPVVDDSAA